MTLNKSENKFTSFYENWIHKHGPHKCIVNSYLQNSLQEYFPQNSFRNSNIYVENKADIDSSILDHSNFNIGKIFFSKVNSLKTGLIVRAIATIEIRLHTHSMAVTEFYVDLIYVLENNTYNSKLKQNYEKPIIVIFKTLQEVFANDECFENMFGIDYKGFQNSLSGNPTKKFS